MEALIEIVDSIARGDTLDVLSETGRFLYIYNSTTLVASVGAIVGLILLGSLLWIAVTSAAKTDIKTHYYGNGGGYRKKRSLGKTKRILSPRCFGLLRNYFSNRRRRKGILVC